VNTGYVIWFAVLVVVAGATLLWLAIGVVRRSRPTRARAPNGSHRDVVLANVTAFPKRRNGLGARSGTGDRARTASGPGPRSWPAPELSPGRLRAGR